MTTSRALVAARSTTKGTANSPFGGSGLDRVGLPRTRKTGLCPSQTWPTRDVQLKLAIGQTDDPLEREADRVADQVVRVPEPSTNRKLPAPNAGRACGDSYCACQHKSLGERRTNLAIPSLSPATAAPRTDAAPAHTAAAVTSTIAAPGQPLGPDVRAALEGRIGHDLSPVRIHIDASAALSAHQLGAKAYTVGSHVAFAEGHYAPDTKPGMRLLAHEIAHVVQQKAVHQTGGGELEGDDGHTPLAGETLVQRDLAAPVPKPDAEAKDLSDAEVQDAIKYNTTRLTDPAEIAQVRDVIGAGPGAAIDEDFVRALVAFQAVSNIKEDGKLGPVTSSRLSREVRAEARFLGPADGKDLSREARRLDRGSFTITTVNAAHELTNTGSAEFGVQWGVPDNMANGWMVQHVRFDGAKTDCAGNAVATNTTVGVEYWEGWQVRAGHVFIGSSADAHQADTFRTADEGASTKGRLTITGHVTFLPGFNLTEPPWGHTVPQAGALPTLTAAPPGWSDGLARSHQMTATWDDCAVPPTHRLVAIP